MNDVRATPVSYTDATALVGYETALRSLQNYLGDPLASIDRVLAEHPDFALAHLFRAAAARLDRVTNDREKGLYRALELLACGDWNGACAAFDAVLVDYPRDALAL